MIRLKGDRLQKKLQKAIKLLEIVGAITPAIVTELVAMTSTSFPIALRRSTFWALCLTLFVISYNISVMPPIMPLIVRDFDSSMGYIQIVIVLFSLVTASFAPTCENLCRFYGRDRVFLTGLAFYGIGILWTALSQNIGVLVISFSFLTGLAATPLVSAPGQSWT